MQVFGANTASRRTRLIEFVHIGLVRDDQDDYPAGTCFAHDLLDEIDGRLLQLDRCGKIAALGDLLHDQSIAVKHTVFDEKFDRSQQV
jgi:hypothetical protein